MNKAILFLFLLLPCAPCFAQYGNETITITTYYPSPHGVYGVLTLYHRDQQPDPATTRKGDLYYDNGTEDPTNRPEGVYVYNGSIWTLTNLGGGASSGDALVYSVHTKSDCTNHVLRGEVVDTDVGFQQCRFGTVTNPVSECPSGWTWFKNYRTAPYGQAWTAGYCLDCIATDRPNSGSCDKINSASSYGVNICDYFPPLPWGDNALRSSRHGVCCSFSSMGPCISTAVMTWRERYGQSATQVGCY